MIRFRYDIHKKAIGLGISIIKRYRGFTITIVIPFVAFHIVIKPKF